MKASFKFTDTLGTPLSLERAFDTAETFNSASLGIKCVVEVDGIPVHRALPKTQTPKVELSYPKIRDPQLINDVQGNFMLHGVGYNDGILKRLNERDRESVRRFIRSYMESEQTPDAID